MNRLVHGCGQDYGQGMVTGRRLNRDACTFCAHFAKQRLDDELCHSVKEPQDVFARAPQALEAISKVL